VRLLAVETATDLVGTAVAVDAGATAACWSLGRRRHAESLAPMVHDVCHHSGVELSELDAIAVDVGPGLFTGLRVGLAMANALGVSLGIGVLGVGSLDVLAQGAADAGWRGELASVVDARRGQVFVARYTVSDDGSVRGLGVPGRCGPDDLPELLGGGGARSGEVLAVGDGALRYADRLGGVAGVRVAGPSVAYPSPPVLASLASRHALEEGLPEPGVPAQPEYLRAPDVKVGWVRRSPA
jgi:tRNA threonylcarbamoyladenosine biosynthesis protein TsaB